MGNFKAQVIDGIVMIRLGWFKSMNDDHGYCHVDGLSAENMYNNGMYLSKTAELIQEFLYELECQVREVSGDSIEQFDANEIEMYIKEARERFSCAAVKLADIGC